MYVMIDGHKTKSEQVVREGGTIASVDEALGLMCGEGHLQIASVGACRMLQQVHKALDV